MKPQIYFRVDFLVGDEMYPRRAFKTNTESFTTTKVKDILEMYEDHVGGVFDRLNSEDIGYITDQFNALIADANYEFSFGKKVFVSDPVDANGLAVVFTSITYDEYYGLMGEEECDI